MHEDRPGNAAIPCDLPTGKPPLEGKALDLADILGHEQVRATDNPVSLSRPGGAGTRPARIIWLEDEQAMIRSGLRLLAQYFGDYSLVPCFDGDAALREIANQPPDLLITDYHHPGARLAEILSRIGEAPARFPILVVSACAAINPGLAQAELLGAYPSFAIDVLGEPICQHLIPAVLKHLAPSDGPLNVAR